MDTIIRCYDNTGREIVMLRVCIELLDRIPDLIREQMQVHPKIVRATVDVAL